MTPATIHALPIRATENHYCARCRRTAAFVDRGDHLICPTCQRRIDRVAEGRVLSLPLDLGVKLGA